MAAVQLMAAQLALPVATMVQEAAMAHQVMVLPDMVRLLAMAHQTITETWVLQARVTAAITTAVAATLGTEQATESRINWIVPATELKMHGIVPKTVYLMHGTA